MLLSAVLMITGRVGVSSGNQEYGHDYDLSDPGEID